MDAVGTALCQLTIRQLFDRCGRQSNPQEDRTMRNRIPRIAVLVAVAAALVIAIPVLAAVIDEATAAALCQTSYPGVSGPEPLSACQWDMQAINAGPEQRAAATGAGVRVGIIDGGVDMTHPDVVPNLDVDASCSFIFDDTPTADPQEIANGDCSNKAAVQDLQGHGTHVATRWRPRSMGSASSALRLRPPSWPSRPAPSPGSASPIPWRPRCATPAISSSTWST
jgi:subtilisin family serine protease